ncbi:hypothetical protein [Streptomyces xanthophaeus]|uniref:hypothetical protein n=1 Tax=Streptomyces xanthophaeus TaxID=67385 RepID=UPI00264711C4|nr:hypothetical protein [Streptomyces xanthophaeus]WKD36943.1 hypothetical protein KO717_36800 [Streptomyces xanthophaeus]
MSTALRWVAKAAVTALGVLVLVLVRALAGPPYWGELLLTAAVAAAGAWAWSRIDAAEPRPAEPQATARH